MSEASGSGAVFEDQTEDFNERYRIVREPVMRRIEARVIGTDYGATSYTTREQADLLARRLDLRPGKLLLDIGSGTGWPGIYLSKTTGCDLVLSDKPFDGLQVAAERLREEDMSAGVVATGGENLPFRDAMFDAVTSSDVLC